MNWGFNCKDAPFMTLPLLDMLLYQIFTLNNDTILRANDTLNKASLTLIFASYNHNIVPSDNFPVPNEFLSCFPTHFRIALHSEMSACV
uniref:Uncharacterized protein n=1 Tax=Lotus japonicus TaxID=34305 RepID=I3T8H7_LOTJA|nr:unknown [Lotus japonicus]